MILKKILISFLILLSLTHSQQLPGLDYLQLISGQSSTTPNKLIPGADIVGCGFDSTSLQDKRRIFQLEGETTEWNNPSEPSIKFDVPDELVIMNKPESLSLNGTTIFSSFDDFVKETFWETRQDSSGFLGFGAKRKTIQNHEFYNRMYARHQRLALNLRQITWYTLKIPTFPKPKFDSLFQQSVDMLPSTYNNHTAPFFKQFIEAFGTHVVVESDFGGMVYAEDWFETCLFKVFNEEWVKEEIKKRYDPFGFFRKNGQSVSNTTHVSTEFKENSEFHALLLGGTDTIQLDQWAQWVSTINYNPKALNRKLVPLSNFLEDGPKRIALSQAILEFRQEAAVDQQQYISDLQQIIPPPKPICSVQHPQVPLNFKALRLQYQEILEEALEELCPFPGFHGNYCPGEQKPVQMAYKRQLQQNSIPAMPSGIGTSFDVTTGELKLPAIQLTYQENPQVEQIWTDTLSNNQYIIADETIIEQINSQSDVKVFKNEFELINIWLDATQRGQWLGGEYSSSKDLNEIFEKFFKGEQETSISQLTKNVVRLTFKSDDLKLNNFAQRAVDSLPQDFIVEVYNDFLNSWGTHVAVDTYLGGMIEKQTVFKDCVYSSPSFTGGLSPDQVEQALNNELHGNQAEGYFTARRRVSIDHKFGGNPEDVSNWESTISQNPALLKINRFMSWDNLVADAQIKANLQQAIQSRIDSMVQRQNSYQQQIQEERRIQRCAPKTAFAITGCGNTYGFLSIKQAIGVREPFQFQEASQCPAGLPYEVSKTRCSSGQLEDFGGLLTSVRYERDDQGNYRTVVLSPLNLITKRLDELYGNWVDRGCSVAQLPHLPQYTDFNSPPPDGSAFKMICTDCLPEVYNAPNGVILQCNCPAF